MKSVYVAILLFSLTNGAYGEQIEQYLWFKQDIQTELDLDEFLTGNYNMARTTVKVCSCKPVNGTEDSLLVYGMCDKSFRKPQRQLQYILDRLSVEDNILLRVDSHEVWDHVKRLVPHPFIDDNIYIFFPLALGPNGDPSHVMTLNDTSIVGYMVAAGFEEDYGDELGYTDEQIEALFLATMGRRISIYQFDALHFSQMTAKIPKVLPNCILFHMDLNKTLEQEMNKTLLQAFIRAYHEQNGVVYYNLDQELSYELDPREESNMQAPVRNPPPKVPPPVVPRLIFLSQGSHVFAGSIVLYGPVVALIKYLLFSNI